MEDENYVKISLADLQRMVKFIDKYGNHLLKCEIDKECTCGYKACLESFDEFFKEIRAESANQE